jgi:hypothetical protein
VGKNLGVNHMPFPAGKNVKQCHPQAEKVPGPNEAENPLKQVPYSHCNIEINKQGLAPHILLIGSPPRPDKALLGLRKAAL